ncbi:uncharacterized protein LOC133886258 [Phragmites australis]|uniref:uncharacterized protein LOC133886258 n=1 Tax=Phragmites australis TaxID=29695 RepID=UPI002D79ECCC|nr:uncharacterized protein LOC133886258 [Phragmites australis]
MGQWGCALSRRISAGCSWLMWPSTASRAMAPYVNSSTSRSMGIEALSLTHPLVAASAPSLRHCLLSAHESVPPQQPVGPPPPAAPHEPVPLPPVFDISRYATLVGVLDLHAVLQELGVESCIYLGHSVYVVIGVLISISRPDHFTKLVLLSASPSHPFHEQSQGSLQPIQEN